MPFLSIVKKPHECMWPTSIKGTRGSHRIGEGTVWECPVPTCKKQWVVKKSGAEQLGKYALLKWVELPVSEYLPSTPTKATTYRGYREFYEDVQEAYKKYARTEVDTFTETIRRLVAEFENKYKGRSA